MVNRTTVRARRWAHQQRHSDHHEPAPQVEGIAHVAVRSGSHHRASLHPPVVNNVVFQVSCAHTRIRANCGGESAQNNHIGVGNGKADKAQPADLKAPATPALQSGRPDRRPQAKAPKTEKDDDELNDHPKTETRLRLLSCRYPPGRLPLIQEYANRVGACASCCLIAHASALE